MKTYIINGKLTPQGQGKNVSGLLIEVLFQVKNKTIHGDKIQSDEQGLFQLKYPQDIFKGLGQTIPIQVTFTVYQEGKKISSKGSIARLIPKETKVELYVWPSVEAKTYKVFGKVMNQLGLPYREGVVQVYDIDVRSEQLLAKTTLKKDGSYECVYRQDQFSRYEKETADLQIEISNKEGELLHRTPIYFNVQIEQLIDIIIDQKNEGPSEYEFQFSEIKHLTTVSLEELNYEDFKIIHEETQIPLLFLKFMQLDALFSKQFQFGMMMFYGLFRQGITTQLEFLRQVSNQKLNNSINQSITSLIIPDISASFPKFFEELKSLTFPDKVEVLELKKHVGKTPAELQIEEPKIYELILSKAHSLLKESVLSFFSDSSDDIRFLLLEFGFGENPQKPWAEQWIEIIQNIGVDSGLVNGIKEKLAFWTGVKSLNEIILPDVLIEKNSLLNTEFQQADLFEFVQVSKFNETLVSSLSTRNITVDTIGPETIQNLVKDKVLSPSEGNVLNLESNLFVLSDKNPKLFQAFKQENYQINNIRDLARLHIDDWESIFRKSGIKDKDQIKAKAFLKQKQIERLYPHEAFKARSKESEAGSTWKLMERFYNQNENLNFLFTNFNSNDVDINFSGFNEEEERQVKQELKTNKRLYHITKDASDALELKKYYKGGNEIASKGFKDFVATTGLNESEARIYYDSALKGSLNLGVGLFNINDVIKNLLGGSIIDNISGDVADHLRDLEGYEEFFGETDFCKCDHCVSIIGPAAYFVDLMNFIKLNVMDVHFATGENPLSPKTRRPDLWNGLKISCENTNELVPYLTIINEVLENFIFQYSSEDELSDDRVGIENHVYGLLSLDGAADPRPIHSFKQPFHLPLAKLETYLRHFPITHEEIAIKVLANQYDEQPILTRTLLHLSEAEYRLISTHNNNEGFLENLFDVAIDAGIVEEIDIQHMLSKMDLSRKEFTQLIKSKFVTLNGTEELTIEKGGADIQFNQEVLVRTSVGQLDRIHRLVCLWKNLDWSIEELDLILACFNESVDSSDYGNIHLPSVASAVRVQHRLRASTEEICTFIHQIPKPLFDKRFNISHLINDPGDRWEINDSWGINFRHPAYVTDETDTGGDTAILHRLLAGLGVDDEIFFLMIEALHEPLGLTPDGVFELNRESITLIYRHTYFLKKFKLTTRELFLLLTIDSDITESYLQNLADAHSFLKSLDWQKESQYSLDELAFILDYSLGNSELFNKSELIAYSLWQEIQEEESLLFADTIFAYVEGISETQSREIIVANPDVFQIADIRKYSTALVNPSTFGFSIPSHIANRLTDAEQLQVASSLLRLISRQIDGEGAQTADVLSSISKIDSTDSQQILEANGTYFSVDGSGNYEINNPLRSDLSSMNVAVPSEITTGLTAEELAGLHTYLLDRIASAILPGAPEVSDRIFMGLSDLDLEESRSILASNSAIFQPAENTRKYWLGADYDDSLAINVPASIPITLGEIREVLRGMHISSVLLHMLSAEFSTNSDKLDELVRLGGFNFADITLTQELANIAQASAPLDRLEEICFVLQKVTAWLGDKAFDAESISFIRQNTGSAADIFHIELPAGFRDPDLEDIKETEVFYNLIKVLDTEVELIEEALLAYDPDTSQFAPDELDFVSAALDSELSQVAVLNNSVNFPAIDADGNPLNTALTSLTKFRDLTQLVRELGIGAEILPLFVSNDYDDLAMAARAVVTAIRTKYDSEETWNEKIGPLEDKIRELKRDALSDYLINTYTDDEDAHWFDDTNDLYNYFLIDTELMGCARTSRLVAGISSLQLYVQRCLLNLEQDGVNIHVQPSDIPAGQWEWRKNYRVWEANRKVFLFPENYIEPDLRDNKTELFEELESTLLQQQINASNVLDAYGKYMKGFEQLSSLEIAGAYHHVGYLNRDTISTAPDTLHLFSVTASDPSTFYYKTITNLFKRERDSRRFGVEYGNWQKLNLQIPVKKVSPIVYEGRVYVFWVETVTQSRSELVEGSNKFTGYDHKIRVKYSSQLLDGTWQAPQTINKEYELWDPLWDDAEIEEYFGSSDSINTLFLLELLSRIKKNDAILTNANYRINIASDGEYYSRAFNLSDPSFRRLLKPKYEMSPNTSIADIHLQAKNSYRLEGYLWDRIYPRQSRNQLYMQNGILPYSTAIDLFSNTLYQLSRFGLNFDSLDRLMLEGRNLKMIRRGVHSDYLSAEMILNNEYGFQIDTIENESNLLERINGERIRPQVINGMLTNGIIAVDKDTFHVYRFSDAEGNDYILNRLNTTLDKRMIRKLYNDGLDGLMSIGYQQTLSESPIPFRFVPGDIFNDAKKSIDLGHPDFKGPMGTYFREIFFHIPFLIANHLNSQGQYADAQRWYHYIFNPTAENLEPGIGVNPSDRVWQYIEFRNMTLDTWFVNLNDMQAINAYENDPFNPHAIARLRLGGYKKSIVMKYIDNLLDWGDHLFTQDTMESINEATLLYVMASEILGKRPAELGDCQEDKPKQTYEEIRARMEGSPCRNFLNSVEDLIPSGSGREDIVGTVDSPPLLTGNDIIGAGKYVTNNFLMGSPNISFGNADTMTPIAGGMPIVDGMIDPNMAGIDQVKGMEWKDKWGDITDLFSFHTSLLKQTCIFCIPANPDLLAYWDRVGDRLFKIRNCMNISGLKRQIPLFSPEIDPRLLVRAKAAGLSLDEVLNAIQGELPPYRFAFLLSKAKEYAGVVQSFGGALLGALEKKSAEELTQLRMAQQDEVLKMTTRLRDMEISAAAEGLEGLRSKERTILYKKEYYERLLDKGLNEWEIAQIVSQVTGVTFKTTASILKLVEAPLRIPPSKAGTSFETPPSSAANTLAATAGAFNIISDIATWSGSMMGSQSGYQRREEGWQFSLDQAENELLEIEKQIEAAEIRLEISKKSREIHEKSIEHHQETYEFYRDKFTGLGLYTWLSTQLQRQFRVAYQNAMTLARMAERAYRFERNDDTSVLLDGSYWDASRAGLMAGEKLMSSLRQMEIKFMETNTRSMEIDQAFSLTQIAPNALLELKSKGECEFIVPEFYFDLFYPGQYKRRIKSTRLTIPCITGPYTNVSAVFTLKESYIRKSAKLDSEGGQLILVPASRTTTVATSSAQNDSGVFRLDFRDERYMPFEGAGAVNSVWKLELPKNFKTFDYSTINDVLIHLSYTADYDVSFREKVEGVSDELSGYLETLLSSSDFGLPRVFSIRQEFSQTFHRLLHRPVGETVPLELSERHFPLFLQGRSLDIVSAKLRIELDENGFRGVDGIVEIPDTIALDLSVQANGATTSNISLWEREAGTKIFTGTIALGTFETFLPASSPIVLNIIVNDAGDLSPEEPGLGDVSALGESKVKDVYLCLDYRMSNSS